MATNCAILSMLLMCMAAQVYSSEFISQDLMEYLTERSNPDVLPQKSLEEPVKTNVAMMLVDIKDVDLKRNEVEIVAWPTFRWNTGLVFDPAKYSNLPNVRFPPSKLWRPDLAVYNGDIDLHDYVGQQTAVLSANGDVLWVPMARIRVACDVSQLENLGNATCQMKIGSWAYSANYLSLDEETYFDVSSYNEHSKYSVLSASGKRESMRYSCCPEEYQHMLYTFSFTYKS